MRPVKRCLMDLNTEEGERYRRAVVEIGDHILSSLSQWSHSEERTLWRRSITLIKAPFPPLYTCGRCFSGEFSLTPTPSFLTCTTITQEFVGVCVKVLQRQCSRHPETVSQTEI